MPRAGSAKKNTSANIGFEATLWLAADKLRSNMDAAEYKHVVLGLIFLKYISDAFEEKHARWRRESGRRSGRLGRIQGGQRLSKDPATAFVSPATGIPFSSVHLPGSDLHFCAISSSREKQRRLTELFSRLTLPDGRNFPEGSIECSIETEPF